MLRITAGFSLCILIASAWVDPAFGNVITSNPTAFEQGETDRIMDHIRKGEYDKALELARALTKRSPNDPGAHNLLGASYLGKKDYVKARESFEQALRIEPDNNQALVYLAQIDMQANDAAAARKRYQAILARDPKYLAAMLGMAQIEAADKNESASIDWLEKAKIAYPDALPPRLQLGSYYLRTNKFDKAAAELSEALRNNSDNAEVLDLLGQAQLSGEQRSDAVSTYKKLVLARPDSALARYRLAAAQISVADLSGAAESLKRALQLKPDDADVMLALAGVEIQLGHYPEALKLAKQLQSRVPKSPAGLEIEADVLMAQLRYGDAAKVYEKALTVGDTTQLAVKRHAAQAKAGDANGADAKLQQWLKAHPADTGGWQYLAGESVKAGQSKKAIELYQIVLDKDPNNLLALNNLANLYLGEKDPRALTTAERAYKLTPNSPVVVDTLGWILVEQGNTSRGLELLQKAAAQDPKNTEVRYHLAAALAKSGDKTKARKELEGLLAGDQKFPQREAAQTLLKQL